MYVATVSLLITLTCLVAVFCPSGERNIREVPVNSSIEAAEPKKDADQQGGEPDEKKVDTQPEEKSTSAVSKNTEQNMFLVRVRKRSTV